MKILSSSSDLPFLRKIDDLNRNFLVVSDDQVVHSLDCCFSLLRVTVLNEGVALADTCLRVPMDVDVVNLSEGFKQFLQVILGQVGKSICQSTDYDLCLPTNLFLLLLNGVSWFDHSHLPKLIL